MTFKPDRDPNYSNEPRALTELKKNLANYRRCIGNCSRCNEGIIDVAERLNDNIKRLRNETDTQPKKAPFRGTIGSQPIKTPFRRTFNSRPIETPFCGSFLSKSQSLTINKLRSRQTITEPELIQVIRSKQSCNSFRSVETDTHPELFEGLCLNPLHKSSGYQSQKPDFAEGSCQTLSGESYQCLYPLINLWRDSKSASILTEPELFSSYEHSPERQSSYISSIDILKLLNSKSGIEVVKYLKDEEVDAKPAAYYRCDRSSSDKVVCLNKSTSLTRKPVLKNSSYTTQYLSNNNNKNFRDVSFSTETNYYAYEEASVQRSSSDDNLEFLKETNKLVESSESEKDEASASPDSISPNNGNGTPNLFSGTIPKLFGNCSSLEDYVESIRPTLEDQWNYEGCNSIKRQNTFSNLY